MKKFWMVAIGFLLLWASALDTQAQLFDFYAGEFSASIKATCEDFDKSGNIKLYTETFPGSGTVYFYPEQYDGCYIIFVAEEGGPATICIKNMALVNTAKQKSKTESFQIVGSGVMGQDIVIMEAKGKVAEDQSGHISKISSMGGKLSGGNPWNGNVLDNYDCIWTANFNAVLYSQ